MISKILEIVSEIKPKSIFQEIYSNYNSVILTTSKDLPNLKIDKILIEISQENYIKIYSKQLLDERFTFQKISSFDSIEKDVLSIMKCKRVPVNLQINYYDVWGNENDGWDVNDISSYHKFTEELLISEFDDVLLSDKEIIQNLLNTDDDSIKIEWSDYTIPLNKGDYFAFGYYFNDKKTGRPIGEIFIINDEENIQNLS
jgi:hypothetical protein